MTIRMKQTRTADGASLLVLDRSAELAHIADLMGLDFFSSVALPSTISAAARKTGKSEDEIIELCIEHAELREYLAGICRDCCGLAFA